MKDLTKRQARTLWKAIVKHDGKSLDPSLDDEQARELTYCLDCLRSELYAIWLDGEDEA